MSEDEDMALVPSADGSRLVIKEMVLENFKSYAGEQRVGPFHKVHTSTP
jgi:structural maintenance of chromosome 4